MYSNINIFPCSNSWMLVAVSLSLYKPIKKSEGKVFRHTCKYCRHIRLKSLQYFFLRDILWNWKKCYQKSLGKSKARGFAKVHKYSKPHNTIRHKNNPSLKLYFKTNNFTFQYEEDNSYIDEFISSSMHAIGMSQNNKLTIAPEPYQWATSSMRCVLYWTCYCAK